MLTVAEIDSLKKSPKKTPDKVADGAGLYLFVTSKSKTWKYLYRFDGKQNTYTIGMYPNILPKEARLKLSEAKALVNQGIDPNLQKRQKIQEELSKKALENQKLESEVNTFEVVTRKWLALQEPGWTEPHTKKLVGRLENHVFPDLGPIPISQITKHQTTEVVEKVVRRKKYETAKRIYQITRSIFTYANDRDLVDSIPMVSKKSLIPAFESKKMPAITIEAELGEFLCRVQNYNGSIITCLALNVFVYLPIRQGEFRHAEWQEFDLEKGVWTIPASNRKLPKFEKRKPENVLVLPLSHQVITILRQLYSHTGHQKYLFPKQGGNQQGVMSENTINQAIKKLGFDGKMTAHGVRASFSTLLNEHGFDSAKIDMLLGHKKADRVESRYNRAQFEKERRKIMQYYADHLDKLRKEAV